MRPSHQTKSRLNKHETQEMDYIDAYVDVKPVDLESMPEPPIGDNSTPEYNTISKKPGQLGGKRKHKTHTRKHKTHKRKHKRHHSNKSKTHKRKHKRLHSNKSKTHRHKTNRRSRKH